MHIDSFNTGFLTIASGQRATLSWAIANPGGTLTASIGGGIGNLATASGSITITPLASTSYTLTCSNGIARRMATISITVLNPVITANHASLKVVYQTDLPITLPVTSVPVVPLIHNITRQPAHGTLTGTSPNLIYRAANGYLGRDNFAYTVTGGALTTKAGGISIEVAPDIPVAAGLSITSDYDTPATFSLPAADPDNEVLTWIVVKPPTGGTLSGTGGSRTFTPALTVFSPVRTASPTRSTTAAAILRRLPLLSPCGRLPPLPPQ